MSHARAGREPAGDDAPAPSRPRAGAGRRATARAGDGPPQLVVLPRRHGSLYGPAKARRAESCRRPCPRRRRASPSQRGDGHAVRRSFETRDRRDAPARTRLETPPPSRRGSAAPDLLASSSPEPDRGASRPPLDDPRDGEFDRGSAQGLCHAGDRKPSGEKPGSRSLARGWASTCRRPFNRRPASRVDWAMSGGMNGHRPVLRSYSDPVGSYGTPRSSSVISRRNRARARWATLRYFSGDQPERAQNALQLSPDSCEPSASL